MQDCGSPLNRDTVLDPRVRYLCQRCTACCRWPGDVRVGEDEVGRIAAFLGLEEREFIERFARLRSDRQGLSLQERENHECIMLDGNVCRIHEVKPAQCDGFPDRWNFPGWREVCQAVAVPAGDAGADGPMASRSLDDGRDAVPRRPAG
jgi:Fe-S-cluster containining protein